MLKGMRAVSENTKVTLSLVIIIIGGVVWLSTLYAKTQETADAVIRLEEKQDKYSEDLRKISNDLYLIKGKLGIYPDNSK